MNGAPEAARLEAALERMTGRPVLDVSGLARLSGGANMESWAFGAHGADYVLRRMPEKATDAARGISMAAEAALLRVAGTHGVRVPYLVGELIPADGLGLGFVMARVQGTASPKEILRQAGVDLAMECARQLAGIHALPLAELPELPVLETAAELDRQEAAFLAHGGDRPVFALALRWLREHLPPALPHGLVHGDFRMGNLMVAGGELTAVLDWELAHLGDVCRDIGWACINSWRFGNMSAPALGLTWVETFLAAYRDAGGAAFSLERVRFWQVFGTLNWGLICLEMARMYRDGEDKTLERLAIGRRVSETEADLLVLLEDGGERVAAPEWREAARVGEPSAAELLGAIAVWLREEIRPGLRERDRFMASVALNALGILEREVLRGGTARDAGFARALLRGEMTLRTPGVLARLRQEVWAKLEIDQPNYSALRHIKECWGEKNAV